MNLMAWKEENERYIEQFFSVPLFFNEYTRILLYCSKIKQATKFLMYLTLYEIKIMYRYLVYLGTRLILYKILLKSYFVFVVFQVQSSYLFAVHT